MTIIKKIENACGGNVSPTFPEMSVSKIDTSLYAIMPAIDPSTFTVEDDMWLMNFKDEHKAFEEEFMGMNPGEEMFREVVVKRRGEEKKDSEKVSKSIILTNLPTKMKSSEGMQYELLLYFHQYGKIRDVYVPRNVANGSMKPFAFIEFIDASSAVDAIEDNKDGMTLGGKKISLEFAVKGRKSADEMRLKEH